MFKVFNQRLAGYLMIHGFKLESITENRLNNNYNIFYFRKSDELAEAIENYKKSNKN